MIIKYFILNSITSKCRCRNFNIYGINGDIKEGVKNEE